MEFKSLGIKGAWLAKSKIHYDDRGSFQEWFKFTDIQNSIGVRFDVKQSNVSKSSKGVLRGIHYSLAPKGQAKWVTCIAGRVIDLVIDLRPNSPTFKKFELIELNGDDDQAIIVGPGLGHGFISLEDRSTISYLMDSPYSPNEEFDINPLDTDLAINWPLDLIGGASGLKLSKKDSKAPKLAERAAANQLPK